MEPKASDQRIIERATRTALNELQNDIVKSEVARAVKGARNDVAVQVRGILRGMMKSHEFQRDLTRAVRGALFGVSLDDLLSSREWDKFWGVVSKNTTKMIARGFRRS